MVLLYSEGLILLTRGFAPLQPRKITPKKVTPQKLLVNQIKKTVKVSDYEVRKN